MPAAVALGQRLFQARSYVPLPLLALTLWASRGAGALLLPGLLLLGLGEGLRLWGVAWIGPRSRTRGDDVGGLVAGGPYRWSRNPLYVGNLMMLGGVAALSGRPWCVPAVVLPMLLHYHLIVRWEESNLGRQLGASYLEYCGRVRRWVGSPAPPVPTDPDWERALRSERGTLVGAFVVAAMVLLVGGR